MAGLADDWEENRQTCVDVLCAYLRMPYEPDPGDEAPEPERLAFRASREVRHTVIRVIAAHLKDGAAVSWQGLDFDFTGVVFDGGDFTGATVLRRHGQLPRRQFSGGVTFTGAEFSGGPSLHQRHVLRRQGHFRGAEFSGGRVSFNGAMFSGGTVTSATPCFRRRGLLRRAVLRRHGHFPGPPHSPAARSIFVGAVFSGGRSTSATLATGHSHPHFPGQARRPQA